MKKIVIGILLAGLLVPASAQATFPGTNGKIAFVRGGDIWTMNPDGANQVNLTNSPEVEGRPAWSPDGNRIAFQVGPNGGPSKISVMYADGSGRTQVDGASGQDDWGPTWSADGNQIIFLSCCLDDFAIWKMNSDGTGRSEIAGAFYGLDFVDSSPAGDHIAYTDEAQICNARFLLHTARLPFSDVFLVSPPSCGGPALDSLAPSWSPDAQRIAFMGIDEGSGFTSADYTIRPDGTDRRQIASIGHPAWSPDGSKIAVGALGGYSTGPISVQNADGTGNTPITSGSPPDFDPSWQPLPAQSPAADVFAVLTDAPDPVRAGDELHYTAAAKNLTGPDTASDVTLTLNLPANVFYVSATPTQGSCSQSANVVTCNFGSLAKGSTASVDVDVEPRTVIANTQISATATVGASSNDPVPANNSASQSTTVTPGGYARPQGASPLRVPLVPSYRQCGNEATLQHGAPLSYPSCGNPQQSSGYLTVGTPDANGQAANSIGSVLYTVLGEIPVDPNNGNQADVRIDFSLTDVRKRSDLSDYTGELLVSAPLRLTDHDNGAGDFTSATVQDMTYRYVVPCAATASTTIGATCVLHTTANALEPGTLKESKRAIWQLGQVQVLDGGADGQAATADNTLFATQGGFVP
jgi:uncharacterized repeat protein (TIGR01451 family)